jgi:serine protease Do
LRVGEKVVAIGNALGEFDNSVTSGIISAKNRPLVAGDAGESEKLQNLIQTDAAINQGNSGGPLVNMNGEVVGMNTAKADAQSIGFSIPINDIKPGLQTVLGSGKLSRPYLGIRYISLSASVAKELGIDETEGAYVNGTANEPAIIPDGPADKAGVKEGDIIIKLDGTDVNEKNQLTKLLANKKVGDTVKLTIKRDGKEQQINVKLEAAPEL